MDNIAGVEQTGVEQIGTDPDRFEAFYREHIDAVQRFVARRVDDPHTAADLTADIFVAVIEAAGGYRPALGSPRAWVLGIARHVVAMEHRRRARHGRAIGRLGGRRVMEPDAMDRALERIDAEREGRRLHQELHGLSPGLRAVFELVVLDELSITDAARVLEISPGSARVRLHRARRRVRDALPAPRPSSIPREASS